jgi:hypothetical protein
LVGKVHREAPSPIHGHRLCRRKWGQESAHPLQRGAQNLPKLKWFAGICLLSHRRAVPSAFGKAFKVDASWRTEYLPRRIYSHHLKWALLPTRFPVFGFLPFEDTTKMPPGLPPLPPTPADPTSALLATKEKIPDGANFPRSPALVLSLIEEHRSIRAIPENKRTMQIVSLTDDREMVVMATSGVNSFNTILTASSDDRPAYPRRDLALTSGICLIESCTLILRSFDLG